VFRSRWPEVVIPPTSLPQFLLTGAADRGARPALIDGLTGRVTSYGQFAALVGRAAAGFAAHGLRKGQVVAILAPNCPEWLVAAYGAMSAGGVVTGVNPLYTPSEIAGHLSGSEARFLVTSPAFLTIAREAIRQAGAATEIVVLDEPAAGVIAFAQLLAHGDTPPKITIDPAADLALLPYSSGTSGLPKGVQLTHRACVANVLQQRAAICYPDTARVLAVAPFFHAVGFAVIANAALHAGAVVVTMPRFEIETFLQVVEQHRITATVVVPPVVQALAEHPALDRHDLSSLEWIGCGAAPLDAALQQACAQRLGRPVLQGYGMTEVTAAAALWPSDIPVTPGAVGVLLPGVRARIVHPSTGSDLGPG
jgi:acyl-CoA synthetase (AMP-forming)/AMP-acid ligase II